MNNTLEKVADDIAKTIEQVEIEMCESSVYDLAFAIREGAAHSQQSVGQWTQGEGSACALLGAYASAKARKYLA